MMMSELIKLVGCIWYTLIKLTDKFKPISIMLQVQKHHGTRVRLHLYQGLNQQDHKESLESHGDQPR